MARSVVGLVDSQTDLERLLSMSPSVLYWRTQSPGTVNRDGTGAVATGTDLVGRIPDLSGNNNYAAAPADGNRSTLSATGWGFDGTDDYYTLASALTVGTNYTVVRGFKRATAGIVSLGLGNSGANTPYDPLWFTDNNIYSWLGPDGYLGTSSTNTNTGSFVTTARRNASAQSLRLNGAAVTTTLTAATDGTSLTSLGRRNTTYNAGEICFLAVFPSELSGGDLAFAERIAAEATGATLA